MCLCLCAYVYVYVSNAHCACDEDMQTLIFTRCVCMHAACVGYIAGRSTDAEWLTGTINVRRTANPKVVGFVQNCAARHKLRERTRPISREKGVLKV